uniref:AlNc14C1G130 protein n=1 Tax=Albugo laibachii Nc14 TaxID=890382 RepID=F0VYY0_9STRA|nr:AlNc14C1G130 [Albugo laibachii Nc14]|eukprot:CCA13995.1 AlNc14C1G130 [Albugo laibachii Nc14]
MCSSGLIEAICHSVHYASCRMIYFQSHSLEWQQICLMPIPWLRESQIELQQVFFGGFRIVLCTLHSYSLLFSESILNVTCMRKRELRLIRPRSGILLAHSTCDTQIWSLAHLLNPTESTYVLAINLHFRPIPIAVKRTKDLNKRTSEFKRALSVRLVVAGIYTPRQVISYTHVFVYCSVNFANLRMLFRYVV